MKCTNCGQETTSVLGLCENCRTNTRVALRKSAQTAPIQEKKESLIQHVVNPGDLGAYYKPSGKYTSLTIPLYILLALLAALIVQISMMLTDLVFGFVLGFTIGLFQSRLWYVGIWVGIGALTVGAGGYVISGLLLQLFINLGTKAAKNRNTAIIAVFCVLASILAVLGRLVLTFLINQQINLVAMNNIFDREPLQWVILIIGFAIMLISSVAIGSNTVKDNPFCEQCQQYMKKSVFYLKSAHIANIIHELRTFKENKYSSFKKTDWPSASKAFPNLEFTHQQCVNGHGGYIKLVTNWLEPDEKGKPKRKSAVIYTDSLDPEAMERFNGAFGSRSQAASAAKCPKCGKAIPDPDIRTSCENCGFELAPAD